MTLLTFDLTSDGGQCRESPSPWVTTGRRNAKFNSSILDAFHSNTLYILCHYMLISLLIHVDHGFAFVVFFIYFTHSVFIVLSYDS